MKTAINTRTQEEYDALMKLAVAFGRNALSENFWPKYGSATCICFSDNVFTRFGSYGFYENDGYEIIPFTEFAKANIVEEPDFKALYLEGREVINRMIEYSNAGKTLSKIDSQVAAIGREYLTKHNDLTPNN